MTQDIAIPASGGLTCETCNAQCFNEIERSSVVISPHWHQIMRLIDCPECDRVCYDHTIFDVGEPDLANVAEVQRRHWLDKAAEKKAGADNYDTAYNMTAYRYVREAFTRAIASRK